MPAASEIELILTILLAVMLVGSIFSRRLKIPYTLVLVLMGVLIAASSLPLSNTISYLSTTYLGSLFVGLVLPPLLFESMMNIRSTELRSVIRPGIMLATAGVVMATIVGGILLWKLAGLPLYESFLFSSLISPTDTASVLEIFRRLHVPRKLAALMDAEAAFNDATGVVVFSLILTSGSVVGLPIVPAVVHFSEIFGGGILVGLMVGFGAEIISSVISDTLSETILSISMVFGSYVVATALDFSGLISVAVAGIYYGNLTLRTVVRPLSRGQVKSFWRVIAFVANSVAFLFIGLNTDLIGLSSAIVLIVVAFLAVLVARLSSVYPIMRFFGVAEERSRKWRNVALLGGMRGALSVALVISIPASVPNRNSLVTMVLGVVFLSIAIQGPLLSRYIRTRFQEAQTNGAIEPSVRLSEVLVAIEKLQSMRVEGKLSESEFAERIEDERDRLAELLTEIKSSLRTGDIMKSRAKELFSSLSSFSGSRAMDILRRQKVEEPVNQILKEGSEELGKNEQGKEE